MQILLKEIRWIVELFNFNKYQGVLSNLIYSVLLVMCFRSKNEEFNEGIMFVCSMFVDC